jgi:hypothetical protein
LPAFIEANVMGMIVVHETKRIEMEMKTVKLIVMRVMLNLEWEADRGWGGESSRLVGSMDADAL